MAFFDLSSERQIGMNLGPIPRSAIMAYANEHRIFARDQIEQFFRVIQLMDGEYCAIANSTERKPLLTEASATDIKGAKTVLMNMSARAAARKKRGKS